VTLDMLCDINIMMDVKEGAQAQYTSNKL